MNYFLSYADTTDIFCVSVPKHQRHFLTYYTTLYPWQVRFVRSWNISDNTDKPTRSSSVIHLVLSTSFYWARTSYKPRPLPVCEQIRPRPLLFWVLLNILDIKYSMFDVIFVRLLQSLSMVFWNYQPAPAAICPFPVGNQLRPRLLLFFIIKYSRY